MANLGKYFAPVAVVLAIAVGVGSFMLFRQRGALRQRAAVLADALSKVASIMDKDASSGTSKDVTFTAAERNNGKEGGTLGWEANKKVDFSKTNNSFVEKVGKVTALADEIQQQRSTLRGQLIRIAEKMNCPDELKPKDEEMAQLDTFGESLSGFARFTENRTARISKYADMLNMLVESSQGTRTVPFNAKSYDGSYTAEDDKAFADLNGRIVGMNRSLRSFARGLLDAKKNVRTFGWTFSDSVFDGIDFTTDDGRVKTVMSEFGDNLDLINAELLKFEELKAKHAALEDLRDNLQEEVSSLQDENEKLKELVSQLNYRVFPGGQPPRDVQPAENYGDLDKTQVGYVLAFDAEYNMLYLNLNHSQVMPELVMAVISKGEYIGTLRIRDADEHTSTAIWLSGDIKNVSIGDSVIFADDIMQDKLVPKD